MTRFRREKVICAVCGEQNDVKQLSSTSCFGSPDLDLRPPSLERHTMNAWVQECKACGFVADNIGRQLSDCERNAIKDIIQSDGYKKCDGIMFKADTLACKFYKAYLIANALGEDISAAYALLHAAWDCDDQGDNQRACTCRRKAVPLFEKLLSESVGKEAIDLHIINMDLLRRSKQFDRFNAEYGKSHFAGQLKMIYDFQCILCEKMDDKAYLLSNALCDTI